MRDFATQGTLRLGPDDLEVRLSGRCVRDLSGRVLCWLEDVRLDSGKSVFGDVPQDNMRELTRQLESAYLRDAMMGREGSMSGWDGDDGPFGGSAA